jgi:hypothetical protein
MQASFGFGFRCCKAKSYWRKDQILQQEGHVESKKIAETDQTGSET